MSDNINSRDNEHLRTVLEVTTIGLRQLYKDIGDGKSTEYLQTGVDQLIRFINGGLEITRPAKEFLP
jgi:hypothetical protein